MTILTAKAHEKGDPPHKAERSAGMKFLFVLLSGFLLSIPLLTIYALNWDRQSRSHEAQASITQGWGGEQVLAGPLLVIPFLAKDTETTEVNGKQVTRTVDVWKELAIAPDTESVDTAIKPELRKRSIYQAVVYQAEVKGSARFALPGKLEQLGVAAGSMALDRAELRFGVSDARGLLGTPQLSVGGKPLALEPGNGPSATGGSGFHAQPDASQIAASGLTAEFSYTVRGNANIGWVPRAGDSKISAHSSWASPSFTGSFLPQTRNVSDKGFSASWQIGNLALGQSLASIGDNGGQPPRVEAGRNSFSPSMAVDAASDGSGPSHIVRVELIEPIDLYNQVDRATKYGFLFIGFTFMAFLMFDVIGGVRVSAVEYLMVGGRVGAVFRPAARLCRSDRLRARLCGGQCCDYRADQRLFLCSA